VSYFSLIVKSVQHIEIECPYLKIESDETEHPNEREDNPEIEKEKDLETKLISALDELTKERKKNQSLEEQLAKKNSQEHSKNPNRSS
jgi:hypothetical protein